MRLLNKWGEVQGDWMIKVRFQTSKLEQLTKALEKHWLIHHQYFKGWWKLHHFIRRSAKYQLQLLYLLCLLQRRDKLCLFTYINCTASSLLSICTSFVTLQVVQQRCLRHFWHSCSCLTPFCLCGCHKTCDSHLCPCVWRFCSLVCSNRPWFTLAIQFYQDPLK